MNHAPTSAQHSQSQASLRPADPTDWFANQRSALHLTNYCLSCFHHCCYCSISCLILRASCLCYVRLEHQCLDALVTPMAHAAHLNILRAYSCKLQALCRCFSSIQSFGWNPLSWGWRCRSQPLDRQTDNLDLCQKPSHLST